MSRSSWRRLRRLFLGVVIAVSSGELGCNGREHAEVADEDTDGGLADAPREDSDASVLDGRLESSTQSTRDGRNDVSKDTPAPSDDTPPASLSAGQPCASNQACASHQCVDGVCCATACAGTCEACAHNKTGVADGTCAPVPDKMDPDGECPADTATCGNVGGCDGNRACRNRPLGTACRNATCDSGSFIPARSCDGRGQCQPPAPSACGAYACAATGCKTSCTSATDCVAPNACIDGSCGGKRSNGKACGSPDECSSGNCVDRVCCGSGCTGLCEACTMAKTGQPDGQCQPIRAGEDPDMECATDAQSSCGNDGTCDGASACRRYTAGTSCLAAGCSANVFTSERVCTGQGACGAGTSVDCGRYVCKALGCPVTCAASGDCVASNYCAGGSCLPKKGQGQPCSAAEQCASGTCVDGVCCESACNGLCKACVAAKTGRVDGQCQPVAIGTDPDGDCAMDPTSSCSHDGYCDGNGACRKYGSDTMCVVGGCSGGAFTPTRFCPGGGGACPAAPPLVCGNYACTATGCKTSCSGNGDCANGSVCSKGACLRDVTIDCGVLVSDAAGYLTAEMTIVCAQACFYAPNDQQDLVVGFFSRVGSSPIYHSFLTFDCAGSPTASTLQSATLTLHQKRSDLGTNGVQVDHMVFSAIGEMADKDAALDTPGTLTAPSTEEDKTIDLTGSVRADLQASRTRSQYRLRRTDDLSSTSGSVSYAPAGGANPPRLRLRFLVP